ncbi:HAD family hydrolase [Microlunatus sp. GCM10028923]|uniref:HAD family hydrolase n=1 Tax=Microlunatus sp. GCM10028923 TaxID=3273400 RepID=UPI0036069DCB
MPIAGTRPTLILWDIDHTLIETRGVGGRLARAAFAEVTGIEPARMATANGKTEGVILAETLRAHDIEPTEEHHVRYAVALPEQYRLHTNDLRHAGRALPGTSEAIAALSRLPGVIQTVLTGNYRAVSVIKLAIFHPGDVLDLEVGAYADDSADRAALVPIAQRRSRDKYGHEYTGTNTLIIGDTSHDVAAAHHGGASAIAVATGQESADDLRAAGADIVLDDLADTDAVINTVDQLVRTAGL